jgi:hypothetical protein
VIAHLPRPLGWRDWLPPEHGAWAMLGLAAIGGAVRAPGWIAVLTATGAISGLIARHALHRAVGGSVRHRAIAVEMTALGSAAMALSAWLAPAQLPWLIAAGAAAAGQWLMHGGAKRHTTADVWCGGIAIGAIGSAITMAGGGTAGDATLVGLLCVVYLMCLTPLVRARRDPIGPWHRAALAGHVAATALFTGLAIGVGTPLAFAWIFAGLGLRAAWLTRATAAPATPKRIGLEELPVLAVLIAALAFSR